MESLIVHFLRLLMCTGEGGQPERPDWCGVAHSWGCLSWWEWVLWGEASFAGMDPRAQFSSRESPCAPKVSESLSSCRMELRNATPFTSWATGRVHRQPSISLAYSKCYNNLGAHMIREIITYNLKDCLFQQMKKKSIVTPFLSAALSIYLKVLSI